MQCIACLIGLIFIGALYGGLFLTWVAAGYIFKIKNKTVWYLSSIPVFIVMLLIFYQYQTRPSAVYQRVLGFPPTTDVAITRSSDYYFADAGKTFLKFTAEKHTIDKIVKRGLHEGGHCNLPEPVPDWWKPQLNTSILYTDSFFGDRDSKNEPIRRQDFASETECLYYDAITQEAYFMVIGID